MYVAQTMNHSCAVAHALTDGVNSRQLYVWYHLAHSKNLAIFLWMFMKIEIIFLLVIILNFYTLY